MIAKKTKYALTALIYLARKYHDALPVLISDLAQEEKIPKKFLEFILLELKKNGILQSKKGKGGGYFLAKPPEQIILGKVIRILEGPLAPVPCVSQTAYQKCEDCRDENCCGIRVIMKDVRDAIANILDHTTLADVLKRTNAIAQKGSLTYTI